MTVDERWIPIDQLVRDPMVGQSVVDFEERTERGHIQYMFKCLGCNLHFSVYSWYTDWVDKVNRVYCPECGRSFILFLGAKESSKQIYQIVEASMTSKNRILGGESANE